MIWEAVKIIDMLTGNSEKIEDKWEVDYRMYEDPEYYDYYEEVVLTKIKQDGFALRNEIMSKFFRFYEENWHTYESDFELRIVEKIKKYEDKIQLENPNVVVTIGRTKKGMEELNLPTQHYSKVIYYDKTDRAINIQLVNPH